MVCLALSLSRGKHFYSWGGVPEIMRVVYYYVGDVRHLYLFACVCVYFEVMIFGCFLLLLKFVPERSSESAYFLVFSEKKSITVITGWGCCYYLGSVGACPCVLYLFVFYSVCIGMENTENLEFVEYWGTWCGVLSYLLFRIIIFWELLQKTSKHFKKNSRVVVVSYHICWFRFLFFGEYA